MYFPPSPSQWAFSHFPFNITFLRLSLIFTRISNSACWALHFYFHWVPTISALVNAFSSLFSAFSSAPHLVQELSSHILKKHCLTWYKITTLSPSHLRISTPGLSLSMTSDFVPRATTAVLGSYHWLLSKQRSPSASNFLLSCTGLNE